MLGIKSIHRCGLYLRPHLLCIFFGKVQERRAFQCSSPLTLAAWVRAPNGAQGKGEVPATPRRGVAGTSPLRAGLRPASMTRTEKPCARTAIYCIQSNIVVY